MNKYILLMTSVSVFIFADISAQEAAELEIRAAKIRKELGIHTPTAKEREVARIRHELKLDFDTSSKDALLGNNKADTVESLVASHSSTIREDIRSGFSSVTKKLGLSDDNDNDDGYSFSGTLNSFYDTVGLDEGESWGLPSIFGLNEKKKKKKGLFGIGILGGLQDTGNTIFKGMKYSGQSAEFSSGMVYKSSKMYNTMFGMFEDSPFNVFEDEKEISVFDVFEGGNKMLDMFD
jgi:hypothetical protein